ncbi:MAG: hypothetical protein IJH34_11735 [Romboutsia sp.]|nr:hypothetical protein [Romboutsia sp.]
MNLVNFINMIKTYLMFWVTGGAILAIGLIILGLGKYLRNKIIIYIGLFLMAIATIIFLIVGISIT